MKVKLLKKVRKRYSITRVDKLASNSGDVYSKIAETKGLPFFVLIDNEDSFCWRTRYYKTFDEAKANLWLWILHAYGEKFRHKDGKEIKVWYTEPKVKKRKFKLF